MGSCRWIGLLGVLLIVGVATAGLASAPTSALAVEDTGDLTAQERDGSDVTIQHDPSNTVATFSTAESGRSKVFSEVPVISPANGETMTFGGDVDRSIEIRHPESERSFRLHPQAGEETYDVEYIELDVYNGHGEIRDDPDVTVVGPDGEAEIAVDVTGDENMLTDLDSTFVSLDVALLDGETVVDTTGERFMGIAYEGSVQQDSQDGEITLSVDRDAEVDPGWYVELWLGGTDIRKPVEHAEGDDVFEVTIDASEVDPGNYTARFTIFSEEPQSVIDPDRRIVRVFDVNGVSVGGEDSSSSGTGTVSGTVDDSDGPIEGATVRLYDDETLITETKTERDGSYSIEVESGTYDLLFDASGYEVSGDQGVEIEAGAETTTDATLTPIEAAAFDVTIDATDSPVNAGESLAVDATVENVGGESATKTVSLRNGDGAVDETELTLGPGQSQFVTLEWETDSDDEGSHTLVVAAGDETAETAVQVSSAIDGFAVAIESTNAPVTTGERLDVRAEIENVADQPDSQTVELHDENGVVLDQTTVSLAAGESRTVQFEWHTEAADDGEHTLSVVSGDDTAETTAAVDDFSLGVMIQPSSPTTFQTVSFSRVTLGLGESQDRNLVWDFGDGSEASGDVVSNRYMTAGTYEVTVTDEDSGAQDTFDVEVTIPTVDADAVGPVGKSVRGVEREYGGTPLEGIAWEEEFSVELSQAMLWNVDSVEYELDGQTKTADSAEESVTFDLGELDGDSVLTVTAVDEDGTEVEHTETIRTTEIPSTLEEFYDEADITVEQEAGSIDATAPVFSLDQHLPLADLPFPSASAQFLGLTEATISYDATAAAATLDGGAEIGGWQPFVDLNGELDVDGQLDSDLELVDAEASGQGEVADIPGPGFSLELPDAVPGDNELSIGPSVDVRYGAQADFDDQLVLQEGAIQPGLTIDVGVTLDVAGCGVTVGGGGGIDAAYGVQPYHVFGGAPNDPEDIENLGGEITLSARAQIYCLFFELGPDYEWSFDYGSGPEVDLLASLAQAERADWTVQSKGGENPSAVAGEFDRLTDRPLQDTQPAITATDDGLVVAWSSQDDDKPITAGRDLHLRTYDQRSDEWSETGHITDDRTFDERPELASTDDATLAAWSTLDERFDDQPTTDGPVGLFEHQEIAYAIGDASGFSEPVVLTETSDRQTSPAVVAVEDGWVLAWESGTASDFADPAVKYVHVDADGTVGTIRTIDDAASPALGPADGGATLAYATRGDEAVAVVTTAIDGDGSAVEQHRHDGDTDDIVTAAGRTLWIEGNETTPRLLEGTADGVTELDLQADVTSLSGLTLATQDGSAVLGYRARTEDSGSRDLVYRLDRGDGWIHDRSFASPDENLSAWSSDVAFAADGESFHSAFGAQPLVDDPVSDVFVAEHEFRPAYAVSADATDAAVGETSTVSFEVENVGDVQSGDEVSVVVESEDTTEQQTLNLIDAGETVEGNLEVPVDDSGTFTVAVEHDDEVLETDRESTTVTAANPQLSLAAVTTERQGGDLAVTAEVRNDGAAVATDVPIVFDDGVETSASAVIERIEPGDNATATVAFAPEELNATVADRVRIDTDALTERHVADSEVLAWFSQPDVSIASVNYVEDDGLVAEVLVSNRGSGPVTGSLSVVDRSNEAVLGEVDLALAGAEDGREIFETVELPLEGATAGDEIHVLADTTVPDADPSTTGFAGTVGPVLAGDRPLFDVTITDITRESSAETVTLDVTIQNRGSEADSQHVVLDADGEEVVGETVDLAPGNETSITLDYQPSDAGGNVELLVRSATAYDTVAPTIAPGDDAGGESEGTDGEDDGTDDGGDGDEGGPGFGILVAVAGLAGLGYLRFVSRSEAEA